MALLNSIRGPADLRDLPAADLPALAEEIREFLVRTAGPPATTARSVWPVKAYALASPSA